MWSYLGETRGNSFVMNLLREMDVMTKDSDDEFREVDPKADGVKKLPDDIRIQAEKLVEDFSGNEAEERFKVKQPKRLDEGLEDMMKFYKKRCPQNFE